MPGELGDMLTLKVGATTSREILSYAKSSDPEFGPVRLGPRVITGTKVRIECQIEIAPGIATSLPNDLTDFEAWLADLATAEIKLRGTRIEYLVASACIDGPHYSFRYLNEAGERFQMASIIIEATLKPATGASYTHSATTRTAVNNEGLEVVTVAGQIVTDGDPAASTVLLAGTGAGPILPARASGWQRTYEYEVDQANATCQYTCVLTELLAEYPSSGGDRVVDGERTVSSEYDEHNRCLTRYSFSYVGPWAADEIEAQHTTLRAAGGLLSARIAETTYKTASATGEFVVLSQRDVGQVLELNETVSHGKAGPLLREVRYAGTTPLIVQDAPAAWSYTQAGRAVGLGDYPLPPDPLFAEANLAEEPEIVLSRPNDHEFETAWRYRFLFADEQSIAAPHGRDGSEGYY
jgi:hypothetical protein